MEQFTPPAIDAACILIVEDEGIIARDIRRTLEQLGYTVTGTACSATEALEMMAAQPADLVLMDIRIQGSLDGIATATLIRERFQVPMVFLSAHTDRATLDRAKDLGGFSCIPKPFTTADIKNAVETTLGQQQGRS